MTTSSLRRYLAASIRLSRRILLQVMDHATLTDNNGKKADFRLLIGRQ